MSNNIQDTTTLVRNFRYKIAQVWVRTCLSATLLFMLGITGHSQGNSGGMTPPGLAPGNPTGSYALSEIENLNLYSGNLNFNLPLLNLGGRGHIGSSIKLAIDTGRWEVGSTEVTGSDISVRPPTYIGEDLSRVMDFSTTRVCTISWTEMFPSCTIVSSPNDRTHSFEVILPATNDQQTRYAFFPVLRPAGGWEDLQVGYGPGVMRPRQKIAFEHRVQDPGNPNRDDPRYHFWTSLSYLTFVDADGTEHDLIDTLTKGRPIEHSLNDTVSRGRVFVSTDSSAMTFIADTVLTDGFDPPTGYLFSSDGTRCRVVNGLIQWMKDPNGNLISYSYGTDPNQASFNQIVEMTDTLGRQVTITYANMRSVMYDEIRFNGIGGTLNRSIKVWHARMGNVLRSDQALMNVGQLFPGTNRSSNGLQARLLNTLVVSKVELPDGRSYQLKYNSYGEIARTELPTGGVIEYDYAMDYTGVHIQRRVKERRVSSDGGLTWESKQLYIRGYAAGSPDSIADWATAVTVETRDLKEGSDRLASLDKHYFYGDPLFAVNESLFYPAWKDGREYKVESLDTGSGRVLRREETDWEQGAAAWWLNSRTGIYQPIPLNAPPNNPRIAETRVTLENGLVSKKVFKYSTDVSINQSTPDTYNLLTDIYEYDFAAGQTGSLLRRTHTDYVKTLSINGTTYDYGCDPRTTCGQSADVAGIIHLRNLPQSIEVTDGITSRIVSRKEFRYDEPGRLADAYGILPANFPGWVEPTTIGRGNVTTSRMWLDTSGNIQNNGAYLETGAQYDRFGNIVRGWDARGNISEVKFAAAYNYALPTETISADPDGNGPKTPLINSNIYDFATGVLLATTDANNQTTSAEYSDQLDRLTKIIRPDGGWTSYEYGDQTGNLYLHTKTLRESSPADKVLESYQFFDAMGRSSRSTSRTSESSWSATASNYDGVGRIVGVTNPYETSDYTGALPQPALWTTTDYDALGRAWKVTMPDGAKAYTLYDGLRTLVTDQAGKQRLSRTDALDRLLEVWEIRTPDTTTGTETVSFSMPPDIPVPAVTAGYRTTYAYDALGNLLKVSQGAQRRYFAYDSLSRMIRVKNPEQETLPGLALTGTMVNPLSDSNNDWSLKYEYDENGNLKIKTDARGISTKYIYDAINRVTLRDYSDTTPDVTYAYDNVVNGKGLLTSTSSSVSKTEYNAFDIMGRVKSSSQTIDGVTYSMPAYNYDLTGNLTSQTYPSGRIVATSYDDAGRLSKVSGQKNGEADKTYVSSISYTAHGAVEKMKLGNQLWERTIFNNRLQPTQIGLGTTQNSFDRLKLDYDYGATSNNGNVQSQTITIPGGTMLAQTYSYDDLNRLKSAGETNQTAPCRNQSQAVINCWKQTYSYDRFGNRTFDTTDTTADTVSSLLAIDPANNRLTLGQGQIAYDKAGNLTTDFAGHTFSYDAENKQILYDGGNTFNGGASYVYDESGQRVKTITPSGTTVFVYDAMGKLVAEYGNTQPQSTGGTSYLTADNLGTPRVITGKDGEVKSRHDYLPFGEDMRLRSSRSEQTGYISDTVRQKFTGYERDNETSLDYAHARYYSSSQGRFTSVDPLIVSAKTFHPQTWNRYIYVNNNPLNYIDSTGLDPEKRWLTDGYNYYSVNQKEYDSRMKEKYDNGESIYWEVPAGTNIGRLSGVSGTSEFRDSNKQLEGEEVMLGESGNFEVVNTSQWGKEFCSAMQVRAEAAEPTLRVMFIYMTLFTGPIGGAGKITSLGLGAEFISDTTIVGCSPIVLNLGKNEVLKKATMGSLDFGFFGKNSALDVAFRGAGQEAATELNKHIVTQTVKQGLSIRIHAGPVTGGFARELEWLRELGTMAPK